MLSRFKTRSSETERLDRGEFTSVEYRRWQTEMWFVHRFFGEIRALKRTLLGEIANSGREKVSVLDVAAGSGELLRFVTQNANGPRVFSVGAESSFKAARSIATNGNTSVQCDALALPFAPDSFDFVFCTLFLHHLNESQAADALVQMATVARRRVLVIDLDRRALPYFAYRLFGTLLLQRFTREDGSLSILRSHRPHELERIANRAGLEHYEIKRCAINRLVLSASV